MLRIYNTLTDNKEEFSPLKPPYVNMYTCGVTVYDDCHIGHGRSLYIFDTIRRFLLYRGYKVKFIRNITDIDDKIIKKAKEWSRRDHLPLGDAFDKVRVYYIRSYYDDLSALGISKANIEPLATENIPQMIDFIKALVEKGFAYEKNGSVYFGIRKFSGYGRLSKRKIDDLFSGVRIDPDPSKIDPLDFALWKSRKDDEPSWNSFFGEGRPGWHIECSAMANRFLGETIDIHGGGKDLIFPHHENEIAQSEALSGKQFARFWVHHGLLTIEGQKMSKSLGNFITLKDAISKYSSSVLKIVYLSNHYRSPLDFSQKSVQEAMRVKERVIVFLKQLNNRVKRIPSQYRNAKRDAFSYDDVRKLYDKFIEFMDDDFNMPGGFSVIFDVMRLANSNLDNKEPFFYEIKTFVYFMLSLFSLEDILSEISEGITVFYTIDEHFIEEEISRRAELRKEHRFKEADDIRTKLGEKGIILEDQPDGKTIWYRK